MKLLTPEQVAAATQLSTQTIREKCATGELGATKLCGRWRIPEDALSAWIAKGEPEPGVLRPRRRRSLARERGFRALVGGKANG